MSTTLSAGDQAAIGALTQKVLAAWAYHDAKAFAGLFVEDGTMTLPGAHAKGRQAILEYLEDAYATFYKGTQVTGKPIDLRPLGPDSAILLSQGGILDPGESEIAEHSAIRAAWIVVRENGEWKLSAYMNTPLHEEGFIAKKPKAA